MMPRWMKGFGSARKRRSRVQFRRVRVRAPAGTQGQRTNTDRRLSRERAARTEIMLNCHERGRRAPRGRARQKN